MTVLVDAAVYSFLLHSRVPIDVSKALGLLAATVFAFFVNRYWAFDDSRAGAKAVIPFVALYLFASLCNVGVNSAIIRFFGTGTLTLIAAWFVSTATSASLNYFGMRYFVFPKRSDD